jgi:hypothetical protein
VSVHVLDPAGAPLAGARVALVVDGVPSTAAVTGGDGTASVLARFDASATVAVTVVPGDDTPWPRLEGTVLAADLAQPVEVAYAAGLQARPLAGALLARDGAPVAAAAVMLVGEHAQAGQVTIGGAEASALGRTLRSGSTTALGELVLAAPIAGTFELALRDALGAAVVAVDSQLAAPTNLAVAAPRTLTATVVGPDGAPLAGVRGTAVASGALAALAPSSRSTLADADGVLRWDDAPGGRWDVVLDDPSARVGRVELLAQLGPTLGTAAMPAAVHLEGKVTRAAQGTAVAGAVVTLLCSDCEGIGAARPIAVAVTSAVGGFRLAVPDPGTGGR